MIQKVCRYYGIALLALVLDQGLKLWVHFNIQMGDELKILGNWFRLSYTLNPGMAFGIQFGFPYEKIILTIIRIIATVCIIRCIWRLSHQEQPTRSLLWGWALVLGGAAGNGIDSIFYGKLLGNAPFGAPMHWFYGQVIDMLYIDIWSGRLPTWIPWVGGTYFYSLPICNIADVSILVGIGLVLVRSEKSYPKIKAEVIKLEEVEKE